MNLGDILVYECGDCKNTYNTILGAERGGLPAVMLCKTFGTNCEGTCHLLVGPINYSHPAYHYLCPFWEWADWFPGEQLKNNTVHPEYIAAGGLVLRSLTDYRRRVLVSRIFNYSAEMN